MRIRQSGGAIRSIELGSGRWFCPARSRTRVDFENGWGLMRASNTTPMLVLRFAGEDEAALADIQALFKTELQAIAPDLAIPF